MEKILVSNKKATYEYFVLDKFSAGVVLLGTEVKSLRLGKGNLTDAWVDIDNGEAYLVDCHISQYTHGNIYNHGEKRRRKLLLNKNEIAKLEEAVAQKGLTIVALKIFTQKHFIKVEIATARGKKLYDKRAANQEKTAERDLRRIMREK